MPETGIDKFIVIDKDNNLLLECLTDKFIINQGAIQLATHKGVAVIKLLNEYNSPDKIKVTVVDGKIKYKPNHGKD